jgi:hypothetical protein
MGVSVNVAFNSEVEISIRKCNAIPA